MKLVDWKTLQTIGIDISGVMLLPTDTVYGLHARVDDEVAIRALSIVKERSDTNYFIRLISSREHLDKCGVTVNERHRNLLETIWPGPYTVLLNDEHGETYSFRRPEKPLLCELLDHTGPLLSTSANWHGEPTITMLDQLDDRLSAVIDYAVDDGLLTSSSSTIIQLVR
jgi:L-threonylcarbamoyladenylate synthase